MQCTKTNSEYPKDITEICSRQLAEDEMSMYIREALETSRSSVVFSETVNVAEGWIERFADARFPVFSTQLSLVVSLVGNTYRLQLLENADKTVTAVLFREPDLSMDAVTLEALRYHVKASLTETIPDTIEWCKVGETKFCVIENPDQLLTEAAVAMAHSGRGVDIDDYSHLSYPFLIEAVRAENRKFFGPVWRIKSYSAEEGSAIIKEIMKPINDLLEQLEPKPSTIATA